MASWHLTSAWESRGGKGRVGVAKNELIDPFQSPGLPKRRKMRRKMALKGREVNSEFCRNGMIWQCAGFGHQKGIGEVRKSKLAGSGMPRERWMDGWKGDGHLNV
jgi:hypothetical protein